jgi:hypothetical protein
MDRHGNGEEFVVDKAFNVVTKKLSFQGFDKNLFRGRFLLILLSELWKARFLLYFYLIYGKLDSF